MPLRLFVPASALALMLLAACDNPNLLAKVGKTEVLRADLEDFAGARARLAVDDKSLDSLVDRELLAEGARRQGIASEPKVRARLAALEREVLAQAMLEHAAAEAAGNEALRKRYADSRDKLSRKRVHVRQLVVRFAEASGDDARVAAQAKINALYSRVLAGEDFAAVAREGSEDPITAARGGDLGSLLEGQVDATFFAEAAALKNGETSKPFRSPFGFHLIKAIEDPALLTPSFEESRGKLAAEIRLEQEQALIQSLRASIRVKRYPEHLPAKPAGATPAVEGK